MFTIGLKRLGAGALALGCGTLIACNDDVNPITEAPRGTPDSGSSPDTGEDSGPKDSGHSGELPCTGGAALAILGNYTDATGTQHWLRRTASAVTYSRIASGALSNDKPPALWSITQVCSDQKVFVAKSEKATFMRVDWAQDSAGVRICVATEDAADAKAALSAPLPASSANGCKGGPWTVLSKKDGGQ